jgi:hypothetical protein
MAALIFCLVGVSFLSTGEQLYSKGRCLQECQRVIVKSSNASVQTGLAERLRQRVGVMDARM